MNTTFFEFVHNSNLNIVMNNGKMLAYQQHSLGGRGKDTFTYRHPFGSAIGISKKGNQISHGYILILPLVYPMQVRPQFLFLKTVWLILQPNT